MRIKKLSWLILLLPAFFNSCNKDDETPPAEPPDSGVFTGILDGVSWHPPKHKAIYYPRWQELYIIVTDDASSSTLNAGINLDSSAVLKKYMLEPNGSNVANISTNTDDFNTDYNVADAGGSFELTKLDTVQKLVSGNLQFRAYAYAGNNVDKRELSSSIITDIPLTITQEEYDGSYARCTVNGVKTTDWYTKEFESRINCISDGKKSLNIQIFSVIKGHRTLKLQIPLVNGAGSYAIYPNIPPYSYCGSAYITSVYNLNNNTYFPTSGTINISAIDPGAKTLTASFNLTVKDTSGTQEIIQITNGEFHVSQWMDF